jgi:hypothetical protein
MAGMLGMAAASRAEANSVHTGHFWCVANNSAIKAATETSVVGVSTAV